MLDTVWRLMGSREQLFDPTHPAAMYHMAFLSQFVGLAGTRSRWIGIGLNPDWDFFTQLDVILRAPGYYKIQGTNPGIIEAISMWLRYDGSIRLYQPFGDVPTVSPPRWADYYTPYDQYVLRNFEDARILGLTDYSTILSVDRKWRRFTASSNEWEYGEPFGYSLHEAPAIPTNYIDPAMGPRNAWKFFYLDKTTWNQIFGDIHKLDIEALPSLTRPTNVGWLSYVQSLELRSQYGESETNTVKEEWYDVDGFKYHDYFPLSQQQYINNTRIVTRTVKEQHSGNYFACFQYYDLLPILPGTLYEESVQTERIVQVDGYFPCATYGDIPSGLVGASQDLREKSLRIVTEPGIYPGFSYTDTLADISQATTVETENELDVGTIGLDIGGDYYTPYGEAVSFGWYGFTETSITTTRETLVTPAYPFYAPSYQYWEEVTQESEQPTVAQSVDDWMIGANSFDALFQEISDRTTTEIEDGNYGYCLAWEYIGNEATEQAPIDSDTTPTVTIRDGYYPGATYGDSWEQLIVEYVTEWSEGNLSTAADYFTPYTTAVYPNPGESPTQTLAIERSQEVETNLLESVDYFTPFPEISGYTIPEQQTVQRLSTVVNGDTCTDYYTPYSASIHPVFTSAVTTDERKVNSNLATAADYLSDYTYCFYYAPYTEMGVTVTTAEADYPSSAAIGLLYHDTMFEMSVDTREAGMTDADIITSWRSFYYPTYTSRQIDYVTAPIELLPLEDVVPEQSVACWYYPSQQVQYTVTRKEPPFRTLREVEQSAFAGMVYDSVEYREVEPSSHSDYFTPLDAPLPFFTPKHVEPVFINPVWVGGTYCFYSPAVTEVEEPLPQPPTATEQPSLSVIAPFGAIAPFYRPPIIITHHTKTKFPAISEGGQKPYYAPAYSYVETATQHESEIVLQGTIPPSFYAPPYEVIDVEATEIVEQETTCNPGLVTDKITGYREIPSPLPEESLPKMQVRYSDAVHTETTTTTWDDGYYQGSTYEDAFSWIGINQVVARVERIVEVPTVPTNQLFIHTEEESVTVTSDTFYSGNSFGTGYDQPFVFTSLPDIWFDNNDRDIDVDIPEPEGVDISVLGEVDNPEAPFDFIHPVGSVALDESDAFYYPSAKTVVKTVTVSPDGYKLATPVAIATYETPFDQMKEFWVEQQELRTALEIAIVRDDVIVPGVPFYTPASKEDVTISLDEEGGWEVVRGFPPEYLTIFGNSTPFVDFLHTPVVELPPTKVPIVEKVQWCNINELFTTFEITEWFEEIIELPATYYSLQETHPQFMAIIVAENWRWVLETDTGLIITSPTTIYWTRSTSFSSTMKERSLSFDRESGYTNLYLEFVIEPDADWLAFGGTLNVNSQGIISDNFDEPLRISKKSVVGFRFLIPTALVYA